MDPVCSLHVEIDLLEAPGSHILMLMSQEQDNSRLLDDPIPNETPFASFWCSTKLLQGLPPI